jgi:2-hydroxy-3-keto-5-methylthiopentenyl-1-phosphate phosphatase
MVQCDFDDTISVGNVSTAIRTAFGGGGWRAMEEEYLAGKISVEQSNIRQFALVDAQREAIEEFVLTEVVVRDGFREFVEYCRREGVRMTVVSSGLDIYVAPTLKRLGLEGQEFYSARARFAAGGIEVRYVDPAGSPLTSGFKESFVRHFKSQGYRVVYIGDGTSDIVPASEADFVIARSTLQRHLRANGLPSHGFETFGEVLRHVEEIRRTAQE